MGIHRLARRLAARWIDWRGRLNWLNWRGHREIVPAHAHDMAALAARDALALQDLRGRRVLVAGCGGGRECGLFLQAGAAEVHGVDVAEGIGRELRHPHVHYHRCPVEAMSCFQEGQFDLVFSVATMEHVAHIEAGFAEMCRVLRPGGLLHVTSGPLWHSRYGHHRANLFQNFPWIHLCLPAEAIIAWHLDQYPDALSGEGTSIAEHVRIMLDPSCYNMRPARDYVQACAALPMRPVVNALEFDDATHLTPELRRRLGDRYCDEELLAVRHRFIGRK